jgi:hypothetical protein
MKRSEFMQADIEAEEQIEKYQEPVPEYKGLIAEQPIPDIRPAGDSWALTSNRDLIMGIDWASPVRTMPPHPVRVPAESDPEYVERCIRYIMDNGELTNTSVRRVLYQTMSQLTETPREFNPQPVGPYST